MLQFQPGTMITGKHLTRSHDIAGKPRLRRLWPLTHAPRSRDDPVPGSLLAALLEIGHDRSE